MPVAPYRPVAHPNPSSRAAQDVLQNLQYFFGAPVAPEKLKDYSEHHAMTYHFPDAYAGQNTKIRDTLNNLILKSPQNWQTSVGLPFFQIEGTVVEWDEVKFDVRLMQRVPYEGVSRMQTSLRRKHRDRVVRRGLALIIESDFYATDAGRQHFADRKCHASNPTTSPLDSRGDCCVRRAHVHPVLRPGDVQYAPRFEPHGPGTLCSHRCLCLQRL